MKNEGPTPNLSTHIVPLLEGFADLVAERLRGGMQPDQVLTLQQAADLLQFHPTTVARWATEGVIPGRKFGNEWRFLRSQLLDHVRGSS